jgi:serine protease Do
MGYTVSREADSCLIMDEPKPGAGIAGPESRRSSGTRWRLVGIASVILSLIGTVCADEPAPKLTPEQIAQIAVSSVVVIRSPTGLGSGFVAAADGKIVTNFHVIEGATQASIITSDRVEHTDVEVIALDKAHDLAVLRIRTQKLKPLTLGDSSLAKAGEHVVAIGNPLGLGGTISDGLLSAIRELPNLTVLQISAPISRGSSGGPVFNDHGEVIGVSTFLLSGGQNLNFAIPIDIVKPMLAGNKGTPLAAHMTPVPSRNIPHYPPSILSDCPAPQMQTVVRAISQAINVGAPLYNQGNFEACYRIYEGAALEVQQTVQQCQGPKQALVHGIDNAKKRTEWSDKAWAMRDTFDGLLAIAGPPPATGSSSKAVTRHIPLVPLSVIDECPTKDVISIAESISAAIHSGAPLYNSGNVEACYRIYEGAISEIDRKHSSCPAARGVLQEGIHNADQVTDWPAKAWALRDSFDGLMNAIVTRTGATNR